MKYLEDYLSLFHSERAKEILHQEIEKLPPESKGRQTIQYYIEDILDK